MSKLKEIVASLMTGSTYDEHGATKQARKRIARAKQWENIEHDRKNQRWWRKWQLTVIEGKTKEEFEKAEEVISEKFRGNIHRYST